MADPRVEQLEAALRAVLADEREAALESESGRCRQCGGLKAKTLQLVLEALGDAACAVPDEEC